MAAAEDLLAGISASSTAKSYTFNGRTVVRADPDKLVEAYLRMLQLAQDSANGGQMASLIQFDPPV